MVTDPLCCPLNKLIKASPHDSIALSDFDVTIHQVRKIREVQAESLLYACPTGFVEVWSFTAGVHTVLEVFTQVAQQHTGRLSQTTNVPICKNYLGHGEFLLHGRIYLKILDGVNDYNIR